MRALDLFCGAGGVSAGLARAGFSVTGVDIKPQPNYPFKFIQADATEWPIDVDDFDFIWASPPCQGFTAYKRRPNHVAPVANLIPHTRERLIALGLPYCIENVPGAPLLDPVTLCGSMFDLDVRRHRIFETSFPLLAPACQHGIWTRRFKPATNRINLRYTIEIGSWDEPLPLQQLAMGDVNWMTREELSQAIPPAYSEFIAKAFMALQRVAAEEMLTE